MPKLSENHLVSLREYDLRDKLTKPLATVYLNPLRHQVHRIENEDTICIVVRNFPPQLIPKWMHYVSTQSDVPYEIEKIIKQECKLDEPEGKFGVIFVEDKQITIDGAYVDLTSEELLLVKALIRCRDKCFTFDELSYYLGIPGDELKTKEFIEGINSKCKLVNREPLIITNEEQCIINIDLL